MSDIEPSNDSSQSLKVNIDVKKIKGLIYPAQKLTLQYTKTLRCNLVGFTTWCSTCGGSPIKYYCETEDVYICSYCLGICHRYVHIWKALSYVKTEGQLK